MESCARDDRIVGHEGAAEDVSLRDAVEVDALGVDYRPTYIDEELAGQLAPRQLGEGVEVGHALHDAVGEERHVVEVVERQRGVADVAPPHPHPLGAEYDHTCFGGEAAHVVILRLLVGTEEAVPEDDDRYRGVAAGACWHQPHELGLRGALVKRCPVGLASDAVVGRLAGQEHWRGERPADLAGDLAAVLVGLVDHDLVAHVDCVFAGDGEGAVADCG